MIGGIAIAIDAASTEPHSCECGEKSESGGRSFAEAASTEPHSCECGELR